jgi:hypothetical protein
VWIFGVASAVPVVAHLVLSVGQPGSSLSLDHVARELYSQKRAPLMIAYGLLSELLLIWFTYFSGNYRVRDHDKFSVFLMLCGSAVGLALLALNALTGITERLLPN